MKLEVKHLSKKFDKQHVLKNINLHIENVAALAIIGPSGSGKSTFLRILAGLQKPDEGFIAFDGKKISFDEEDLQKYRRTLGIVFQSWNLFPHLTALENIVLPLYRIHGFSKEKAEGKSLELLKRFGLEKHAHKKPYELSGGQKQRVALIRAIAANPKMLLMDEPTSALDPLMTSEVLDLIMELKSEGNNLILVTHHVQFIKKMADRLIFIAEGKIIEEGSVDKLLHEPETEVVKHYMSKVLYY